MNKFLRIVILIILHGIIFTGCNQAGRVPAGDGNLTIATLKGPSSMGMIKLIDSLRRSPNQKVKVIILDEPLQVRKMMIDSTADFVILPATMAAVTYNKGLDYRLAAIPVWGTLYLVGRDTTVKIWNDLRGRRVYVMARGMTPDELFRYLLRKNGIDPEKDISLDYSFPTHIALAGAVGAGRAPLAVLSEPLASMVIYNDKNIRRIFSLNDEWALLAGTPLAETAFMVKNSIVKNNRELIERILASYEASTRWVNTYPDSAASMIVRYGILPVYDAAIEAIPLSNLKFVRAASIKKEIYEYLQIFYRMNPDITGGKLPDENFIYQ